MARIYEPSREEELLWREFVTQLPEKVQLVAERFNPWTLYRLKTSGNRVTIYSFDEPEDVLAPITLKVDITAAFNRVVFERRVFGINPDDLEPCELPLPTEVLGAMLSPDEVDANIDVLRAMARRDSDA